MTMLCVRSDYDVLPLRRCALPLQYVASGAAPGRRAGPPPAEPTPEPPPNSIKSQLKRAIKGGQIDEALQFQKQ